MSVVVLTSASGSPGVTTTTLGLACTWNREVIAVEADPTGGSTMMAGFFGGFVCPTQSIVDLGLAHRSGTMAQQFPQSLVPLEGTGVSVLPGPRSHAQAHHAHQLWEPLHQLWCATTDTDVLVDAGRLGMEHSPTNLLELADLVLLVTRSDLVSLAAAKQWADRAQETHLAHPESAVWKVILVHPGHPYSAHEVSDVLGLEVVSCLPHDPGGARHYSHGAPKRPRARINTSLVSAGQKVRDTLSTTHRLHTPGEKS